MEALEKPFEKKCMELLVQIPKSYWFPKETRPSVVGRPDRLGVINGTLIALEFKATKQLAGVRTKSTEMQKYTMNKINLAGGFATFAYPENFEELFKKLLEISHE